MLAYVYIFKSSITKATFSKKVDFYITPGYITSRAGLVIREVMDARGCKS